MIPSVLTDSLICPERKKIIPWAGFNTIYCWLCGGFVFKPPCIISVDWNAGRLHFV